MLAQLERVRNALVNRNAMICNVTLDAPIGRRSRPSSRPLAGSCRPLAPIHQSGSPPRLPPHEGLTIPAQVNYVAKGANLYNLGYRLHGSSMVVNNLLGTTWLWERVRVQGGAYGGFATFDQRSGVFAYPVLSRPEFAQDFGQLRRRGRFLRAHNLSEIESDQVHHWRDRRLGLARASRRQRLFVDDPILLGSTDAIRQQLRDEVLATTPADIVAFADVLTRLNASGQIVVVGPAGAFDTANQSLVPGLAVTKVL